MAGIFTRKAIAAILSDERLSTEEKAERLFSLYGRALEDGYVPKSAAPAEAAPRAEAAPLAEAAPRAEAAQGEGVEGDVRQSPEYLELQRQFELYRAREEARMAAEFEQVKPKFFEAVFALLDRSEGAAPLKEQLEQIRRRYEEYFVAPEPRRAAWPRFGAPIEGSMPKGETGAAAEFARAWGFGR